MIMQVLTNKIQWYNKTTKPVSDFYKKDFNEIYYDIDEMTKLKKQLIKSSKFFEIY